MKRQPKYKPRWFATEFGLLLPGYWFKASKKQETWWVKKNADYAASENGQLERLFGATFPVFIDLNQPLNRDLARRLEAAKTPVRKP